MDDFVGFVVGDPPGERRGFITLGRVQHVVDEQPLCGYFADFLSRTGVGGPSASFVFEPEVGEVMLGERFFEGFEVLRRLFLVVQEGENLQLDARQRDGSLFIDVGRLGPSLFTPPVAGSRDQAGARVGR